MLSDLKRCLSLSLIFCTACLLFGCRGAYNVPLPNGYRLVQENKYNICVSAPDRISGTVYRGHWPVAPTIVALNVHDDIVFGLTRSPWLTDYPEFPKPPGYFILDTKLHKAAVGLDKPGWLDSLKELGVRKEPNLQKPSRNFAW